MKKNKSFILTLTCVFILLAVVATIGVINIFKDNKTNNTEKITETVSKEDNKDNTPTEKKDRFSGLKLSSEDRGIPILCYHDVTPNNPDNNELLLNPDKFREQLKYLKDNGYCPITLDELYGYLKDNKAIPEKSVVITFDDGYKGNYKYAYPILKEFNFPATVFVVSNFVDNDLYMSKAELKEISKNGFKVESHTAKHDDLSKLNEAKQIETLKNSKNTLENIIDDPVYYVAYPFGRHNKATRIAAEKAGYKLGFNLNGSLADKKDNSYNIDRVYISNNDSIEKFENRLNKSPKN